jgi:hypothetical protein
MMMEQMTRVAMQRSMEEQAPKIPPASERVRDALPRVVVTKEHWQWKISLFNAVNSGTQWNHKASTLSHDTLAQSPMIKILNGLHG